MSIKFSECTCANFSLIFLPNLFLLVVKNKNKNKNNMQDALLAGDLKTVELILCAAKNFDFSNGLRQICRFVGWAFKHGHEHLLEPLWDKPCLQEIPYLWRYACTGERRTRFMEVSFDASEFPRDDPTLKRLFEKLYEHRIPVRGNFNVEAFAIRAIYLDHVEAFAWVYKEGIMTMLLFDSMLLRYAHLFGAKKIYGYLLGTISNDLKVEIISMTIEAAKHFAKWHVKNIDTIDKINIHQAIALLAENDPPPRVKSMRQDIASLNS